ncbi:lamin tail domain-containing protein [bacterium]|nr:lamin tail domain-containing protein [bacterium]
MHRVGIAFILLLVVAFSGAPFAAVRVSEVMSNEPGSSTSLEFIELYNDGTAPVQLNSFYEIRVDGLPLTFGAPPTIDTARGFRYLILCRDLFDFEQHYGDGSGIWGDVATERGALVQPTSSFSLSNNGGSVAVVRTLQPIGDSLVWTSSGSDGVSWERENYVSYIPRQSIDPTGSTPGYLNSRMPAAIDLALDTVAVFPTEAGSRIVAVVTNRGMEESLDDSLWVFYSNPADTGDISDLIEIIAIPSLDTGFSTPVAIDIAPVALYDTVTLRLPRDSRTINNRREVVVVSAAFPPVVLSEFLANPQDPQTAEWIELDTRSDNLHDIAGWRIGDALALHTITEESFTVLPDQYPVVTENLAAFSQDYPDFDGVVVSPSSWATLNNAGDVVRLVDPFGFVADSFVYASAYDGNHTWAKGIDQNQQLNWGRSSVSGGSPGAVNDIRFTPTSEGLVVAVEPQVISPDGDGIDESMSIRVSGPADVSYTIRIYDRKGREVRTFEDGATDLRAEYIWDGVTDSGARLPIGMYILYVEAEGVESLKKTVVVAR